ncbi:protein-disulfide reductase DsbD domain-containing protein [Rubrivirga sp.]|uniref:protein-disulfide reductase DsbD domain-containing protein n=1 Tax=Rubrivirga sp. TaxID=1885344 RepID=UPI003B52C944
MLRLAFLLAVLAVPASAQQTSDVVSWRVRADRAEAGGHARVVFDATIAPGWRLYAIGSPVGIPLAVTLDPLPAHVRADRLGQSAPREGFDPAFERAYPYFAETGRVVQRLAVGRGAARGTHEVTGSVRYAVCDDRICLPPTETAFRVPLVVE